MNPWEPWESERVEVGRYLRRDQAEDRSLVLSALGVRYWILHQEGLYFLAVSPQDAEAATRELRAYEEERRAEREEIRHQTQPPLPPRGKASFLSLFFYVWTMAGFFLIQMKAPSEWTERGTAESSAILKGEVWRVVTALTLHADSGHLVANIAVGLLFAAALLPWLGAGWTWFGFVISGALGNAINAWGFRGEEHRSIGASTAVFGALGMLVGWQVFVLIRSTSGTPRKLRLRELAIPVAAGLALLAYLGTGGGVEGSRVDITAHLFGMLAGGMIGLAIAWARLPERTPPWLGTALAWGALLLPCLAWWVAWWVA